MEKNNVFLELLVVILLASFLSVLPSLLLGLSINLIDFIPVVFLFCLIGVVLGVFFPKVRFVIWIGVTIGAVLVNWLLLFIFVWATNDGAI